MVRNLNKVSPQKPILVRHSGLHALSPGLPSKKRSQFINPRFFSEPWFGFCIL
ncbi:hypothetical protein EC919_108263 [Pseudomonas graminis]|nr:hypothetical protein EC919_108263 [Pseudomonas graminis]